MACGSRLFLLHENLKDSRFLVVTDAGDHRREEDPGVIFSMKMRWIGGMVAILWNPSKTLDGHMLKGE